MLRLILKKLMSFHLRAYTLLNNHSPLQHLLILAVETKGTRPRERCAKDFVCL